MRARVLLAADLRVVLSAAAGHIEASDPQRGAEEAASTPQQ